ncbi:hypothetical protein HPP92_011537 [Vanilla planifolia]|uniref:phosphatidylglycerophosphatase n=1 Tax=Vanilla planifolia TaxID=51239 RepID=A0A835QXS8_VANPL|nr:hypothetical protein HPP92_011537 [Vanilla planifolia]
MRIMELEEGESDGCDKNENVAIRAKRMLVGAGARVLFYPTLLYNVIRNKVQAEFRWWDEVDQYLWLGAVPFQKDVLHLQQLGVRGVITLNEPYETLVPSSLYKAHGIDHLVIPTRDYLFAPSLVDISKALHFIYRNASCHRTTYVHCKAGRGRSATIVLCYLIEYRRMTPDDALEYVRLKRPRVLLAPSQWQVVQEYCKLKLEFPSLQVLNPQNSPPNDAVLTTSKHTSSQDDATTHQSTNGTWDDEVFVTEEDLIGYEEQGEEAHKQRRDVVSRLACLFSTFKFSSSCPPPSGHDQEVQA